MKTLTWTGRLFEPGLVSPQDISITDVAYGLSRQFRFNGLTETLYTVAQHSVLVSKMCNGRSAQLYGLLHDGSEAYIHDLPTPVKILLPDYKDLEWRFQRAITQALIPEDLQRYEEESMKSAAAADALVLRHEIRSICLHKDKYGLGEIPELPEIRELVLQDIQPPEQAAKEFLARYYLLTSK